jgi:hypothetical protein
MPRMANLRTEYVIQGRPGGVVSSVRVIFTGSHAKIAVWNRGGLAGELVVNAEDADAMVLILTDKRRTSWERLAD